jgi:hypothetical protein
MRLSTEAAIEEIGLMRSVFAFLDIEKVNWF